MPLNIEQYVSISYMSFSELVKLKTVSTLNPRAYLNNCGKRITFDVTYQILTLRALWFFTKCFLNGEF